MARAVRVLPSRFLGKALGRFIIGSCLDLPDAVVECPRDNVRLHHSAVSDCDLDHVAFYGAPRDHFAMGSLAPQFSGEAVHVGAETLDSILAGEGIEEVDVLKV